MSYTSWGTRRALGRRYSTDPALIMEMERLQQQYNLAPGREARALQQTNFDKSLAQNQAQFDTNQENAKSSGMAGTAVNMATNAAMVRGMTMGKGEPFFGRTATGIYDKVMGNAPAVSATQPVAGFTQGAGGMTAGGAVYGSPNELYSVNPATMPEASAGVGMGAAAGYGAQGGIGTGIGEMSGAVMGIPGLQVAGAGYAGPKLAETVMPGSMENLGHNASFGMLKGEKDAKVFGSTLTGAAAGAAMGTAVLPGPGTIVGGVIGAVTGFVSEIFGW